MAMITISQQLKLAHEKLDKILVSQGQIEAILGVESDTVVVTAGDLKAILVKLQALRSTVSAFNPNL